MSRKEEGPKARRGRIPISVVREASPNRRRPFGPALQAPKIQFPVSADIDTPTKIIWLPAPISMTVSEPT
jgi:hypothetical protein